MRKGFPVRLKLLRSRLRALWHWKQRQSDIDDEIRFHLEAEAEERQDAGAGPLEARRAARLDFGNVALGTEDTRAAWRWSALEQLVQDARYAIRTLSRSRSFTATAILCLALGIGANTLLYSLTDAILLRELPVTDAGALVRMTWRAPQSENHGLSRHNSTFNDAEAGYTSGVFSYAAFELFARRDDLFSSVFAYQGTGLVSLTIHDETAPARGEYVSGSYFRGLGVVPGAGRLLGPADDRDEAPPVVMITTALAERRFGRPEAAVGQTVQISNTAFTVVGVVPRTFFGTDPGVTPEFYAPLHAAFLLEASRPKESLRARFEDPSEGWLEIMARLEADVTLEQAQTALAPPFQQFTQHVKDTGRSWEQAPALNLVPGAAGVDGLRRGYSTPLLLLMGLAGLILLLACSNVANLLLARSAARAREIAVRMSLGAGRARVARQLLTESLVLSCAGGLLGIGIAVLGEHGVSAFLTNGQTDFTLHADLNWRVLLFALGLSIATGVIFGVAPAIRSTRKVLLPAVRDARSTPVSSTSRRGGLTRAMVVLQIGATLVLLVVSGLFARTLARYAALDLGFNPDRVLTVAVDASQAGFGPAEAITIYDDLRRRFAAMPGVVAAGMSERTLMGDGRSFTTVLPGGPHAKASVPYLNVGARFLTTMEVRLLKGREIDDNDTRPGAKPVAVVSDAYASKFFGDANPLGQRLSIPSDSAGVAPLGFEIVGVAADVRYGRLLVERPPLIYIPYSQMTSEGLNQTVFAIRTSADPSSYERSARAIVRGASSRIPVTRVATQSSLIDRVIATPILLTRLCATFAMLALTIAVIGLYGSVAYDVSRRTPEIGVRVALGAGRRQIVRLVLGNVVLLAAAGIVVGVPGALFASTFTKAYLYGVTERDPITLVAATAVLLGAALLAAYGPARAAARLDPTRALRQD
jgi:macrolide transport system ATP-binding/permease protein